MIFSSRELFVAATNSNFSISLSGHPTRLSLRWPNRHIWVDCRTCWESDVSSVLIERCFKWSDPNCLEFLLFQLTFGEVMVSRSSINRTGVKRRPVINNIKCLVIWVKFRLHPRFHAQTRLHKAKWREIFSKTFENL